MSAPLVVDLGCAPTLVHGVVEALDAEPLPVELRRFPDQEIYVRLLDEVVGRELLVLARLDRPDLHLLEAVMLAETARDLGAARISLLAPYLPYMRQDRRFESGEGVTSRYFAQLVAEHFDRLATVDPHLHRYHDLSELYSIPAVAGTATAAIADWIAAEVEAPVIVGPDSESGQWVRRVAEAAGAGFIVAEKRRHGDRDVDVVLPGKAGQGTPVLVDDIISSAHTMARTAEALKASGWSSPVCVGIHAVFAEGAEALLAEHAARVVTSDTVPHTSNAIEAAPALVEAFRLSRRDGGGAVS